MKYLAQLLFLFTAPLFAQLTFTPPPMAAYVNAGSGWNALTGTGGTPLTFTPPPAALYVYNGSAWVPWAGASGGAPTTCTSGNNYPCLNTNNSFTALNAFGYSGTPLAVIDATQADNNTGGDFGPIRVYAAARSQHFTVGYGSSYSTSNYIFDATNGAHYSFSVPLVASTSFAVNGSQALTGIQGTAGTNFAAASGTFINGNLRSTNGTGDEVDSGVVAASVALKPVSNAVSSATGGSGITAVTCSTTACTNLRGTYTMTATTVSAGTILTLVWPTTTTAYACQVVQNGGATSLGLSHNVASATGMVVSVAVSVATGSITFDYSCQP